MSALAENQTNLVVTTIVKEVVVTDPQESAEVVVSQGSQGPRGIPGASTQFETHIAGTVLGGNRAVYLDQNNRLRYPNILDFNSFVVGITVNSALQNEEVQVQLTGTMTEPSWNWTPGMPVFVGLNGVLTQTVPQGQVIGVGWAILPNSVFIDIQPTIYSE